LSESFTKSIIQTTLEKDYKDAEFVRLMRENIIDNIEKNEFYRNMVKNSNFNVDDLNSIDDLASIPFISTTFYKQSANMYKKLLKIPEDEIKHWNCSSTTSGDPSLVGVNEIDMNFLYEMSRKCFLRMRRCFAMKRYLISAMSLRTLFTEAINYMPLLTALNLPCVDQNR